MRYKKNVNIAVYQISINIKNFIIIVSSYFKCEKVIFLRWKIVVIFPLFDMHGETTGILPGYPLSITIYSQIKSKSQKKGGMGISEPV